MTEERKNQIIEKVVEDLITTEAGLAPENAGKFREYVDLHANDTVRQLYGPDGEDLEKGEMITEEELREIIKEVVKSYNDN